MILTEGSYINILKKRLDLIILVIIIPALVVYVFRHQEEFKLIKQIDYLFLFPMALIVLAIFALNGLITKLYVKLFGTELTPREWFGLSAITAMGNYLAPFRGGIAGKALYLKKKHQFPYTSFLAAYTSSYILLFLVGSLLGLLSLELFYLSHQLVDWRLVAFFFVVLAVIIAALKASSYTPTGEGRIAQHWRNLNQGWQYIKDDKSLLLKVSLLFLTNFIMISLQLYFGYMAIAHQIPYQAALFMAVILSFSIFTSITPGNLGVQESVIAILSQLFGLGFNEGLLVAGLLRIVLMSVAFTLGPIYSYIFAKSISVEK